MKKAISIGIALFGCWFSFNVARLVCGIVELDYWTIGVSSLGIFTGVFGGATLLAVGIIEALDA